jgi:hypothetical protein
MGTTVRRVTSRLFSRTQVPDLDDDAASTNSKRSIKASIRSIKTSLFHSSRDPKETILIPAIEIPPLNITLSRGDPSATAALVPVHSSLAQTPVVASPIDVPATSDQREMEVAQNTLQRNAPPPLVESAAIGVGLSTDGLDELLQSQITLDSSFIQPESTERYPSSPYVPDFRASFNEVVERSVRADAHELQNEVVIPMSQVDSIVPELMIKVVIAEPAVQTTVTENVADVPVTDGLLAPTWPTIVPSPFIGEPESHSDLPAPDETFIEVAQAVTNPMDASFADERDKPYVFKDTSFVQPELTGIHASVPNVLVAESPGDEAAVEYPVEDSTTRPVTSDDVMISEEQIEAVLTEALVKTAMADRAAEVPVTDDVVAPLSPVEKVTSYFNPPLPDERFIEEPPTDASFTNDPDEPEVVSDPSVVPPESIKEVRTVVSERQIEAVFTEALVKTAAIERTVEIPVKDEVLVPTKPATLVLPDGEPSPYFDLPLSDEKDVESVPQAVTVFTEPLVKTTVIERAVEIPVKDEVLVPTKSSTLVLPDGEPSSHFDLPLSDEKDVELVPQAVMNPTEASFTDEPNDLQILSVIQPESTEGVLSISPEPQIEAVVLEPFIKTIVIECTVEVPVTDGVLVSKQSAELALPAGEPSSYLELQLPDEKSIEVPPQGIMEPTDASFTDEPDDMQVLRDLAETVEVRTFIPEPQIEVVTEPVVMTAFIECGVEASIADHVLVHTQPAMSLSVVGESESHFDFPVPDAKLIDVPQAVTEPVSVEAPFTYELDKHQIIGDPMFVQAMSNEARTFEAPVDEVIVEYPFEESIVEPQLQSESEAVVSEPPINHEHPVVPNCSVEVPIISRPAMPVSNVGEAASDFNLSVPDETFIEIPHAIDEPLVTFQNRNSSEANNFGEGSINSPGPGLEERNRHPDTSDVIIPHPRKVLTPLASKLSEAPAIAVNPTATLDVHEVSRVVLHNDGKEPMSTTPRMNRDTSPVSDIWLVHIFVCNVSTTNDLR